jgi:hypothetical protein
MRLKIQHIIAEDFENWSASLKFFDTGVPVVLKA